MDARPGALVLFLAYGALAFETQAADVDAAIVFAVDASSSVDRHTADLQREGHAEALSSPEVMGAITGNRTGCIAITYFEWSGRGQMRSVLPWTTICGLSDGQRAGSVIRNNFAATGGDTSISFAIDAAGLLLDRFQGNAAIKVIDVSGNGRNNDGLPVEESRNRALDRGYAINAIVLSTYTRGLAYDLTDYFEQSVIGGPNAFVVAAKSKQQYGTALRRKLVREISSTQDAATTARLQ